MLYFVHTERGEFMSALKTDGRDGFFFSSQQDISVHPTGGPQHYHSLFEIYYLTSGKCNYFIHNKSFSVEAGDIIIIPAGTIHRSQYHDRNYSRLLINCSKYYIPSSIFNSLQDIIYVYRNDDILPKINELFSVIQNDYERPDDFSQESLRANMHSLFILMARNANQKKKEFIKNQYIEQAIEFIQKNFSNEITLSSIAKMCSVSPEHLSRTFKKETGFCFSEYLTHIRLKNAEYLLKNSGLSITDIAYQCGFCDSNYFSVIFKRNFGITPSAMRTTKTFDYNFQ